MAENTKIEWAEATWNPITGCSVLSPGCTNCYAMRLAGTRMKAHPSRVGLTRSTAAGPVWNGAVRFNEGWLDQPLRWTKPRRIFVCAHGDLFHEDVPNDWIDQIFAVMARCPQHQFQILTKRAARMRDYFSDPLVPFRVGNKLAIPSPIKLPLKNCWTGTSVEDQKRADERIPPLLDTPAAVHWVSAEPLLGPVDLSYWLTPNRLIERPALSWVVVGGESGPGARPMHPDWARLLRDHCAAYGVPFFFKQWGRWAPDTVAQAILAEQPKTGVMIDLQGKMISEETIDRVLAGAGGHSAYRRSLLDPYQHMSAVGKKRAGRLLDGQEWNEYPRCGQSGNDYLRHPWLSPIIARAQQMKP